MKIEIFYPLIRELSVDFKMPEKGDREGDYQCRF